ncbi:MAG: hypothetical protein ABI663_11780 [Chryseolinea sp.]
MRISCKYCDIELTNSLVEVQSVGQLSEIDGEDFIPMGQFLISNGDYYTGTKNKIIINIKDLKNSKNHTDLTRLNGCCGLDGTDGPNKQCLNGHEIGTEKSDCWMAHSIVLDNDKIIKIE